ncbi:transposase domain-containing protein [Sphingomonas sp. CFBP 13720]
MRDVLTHIADGHPANRMTKLTPWKYGQRTNS